VATSRRDAGTGPARTRPAGPGSGARRPDPGAEGRKTARGAKTPGDGTGAACGVTAAGAGKAGDEVKSGGGPKSGGGIKPGGGVKAGSEAKTAARAARGAKAAGAAGTPDRTGPAGTGPDGAEPSGTGSDGTGSDGTGPAGTGPAVTGKVPGRGGRKAAGADPGRERPRMPPVRLAPRDELAAAARVAPLLRAAMELSRWAAARPDAPDAGGLEPDRAAAAAAELELTAVEVDAAWRVVQAAGMAGGAGADLAGREDGDVLGAWDSALAAILDAEDRDGLATALYTVGAPVRIDALFEAYTAAAGSPRPEQGSRPDGGAGAPPDEAAALSRALETLADLGVVELGTEENAGGLTVTLSPLGVWGVHRRLRGQGWHVPVLGSPGRGGAVGLLMTLASCDAEDGEAEISAWLAGRTAAQAARELIGAAAGGSPGLRGAAFAVLDRIGDAATAEIRAALDDPLLRAHAAVWLHEHDEEAELRPADRTWLLVDLGAGLLEEADPRDVVAELLPEVPALAQAEIVAGLWQVDHPGVIDLLTALSEHHPDPGVARAARKAAFKARSPGAGAPR
jgi:hypothetical protein